MDKILRGSAMDVRIGTLPVPEVGRECHYPTSLVLTAMHALARLLILATASACLLWGVSATGADPQPLRIYLFASSTCPECMDIKANLLPRLQEVYGDRIKVTHQDLDDIENFKLLLLYEKKYGVKDSEALKVFVGDAFLSGAKAITEKLGKTVSEQLAKGATTPSPEAIRAGATAEKKKG
jgi:hypothetical protein